MLGQKLRDRYQILKPLGQGGFGDTYLAKDCDLPGHPQCVVKHLKPKNPDPALLSIARRLFETEAQVLYKLGKLHDRIPTLSAHFEENSDFYFVQDFIDGHDLTKELIPGKKLSESYVINLLQDTLEVLAVVHQHNVIHRDIKPANLMRRQDGKIVVIDFGAVKEISTLAINSQGQTSFTIMIGSPGYMPSEQAKGKPKFSSDIYAVGMIGIQALTGQNPKTLPEDQMTGEVIWRDRVQVSQNLANILDKMVRDHFSQRYQNAEETLQALLELSLNASIDNVSRISVTPQQKLPSPPAIALKTFDFEALTVNSTGQITNRRQLQAKVFTDNIGNGVTIDMIAIPGGSFVMGSSNTEAERIDNEGPEHNVTVAPFFLGKYPVTQEQWEALMGNNPAHFKGAKRPVEKVSWNDAVEFCQKLSEKTGKTYRLPSEAEWEYACRAGTKTPFYFGETITPNLVNYDGNNPYSAAPNGLDRKQTTNVGSFPPNAFGLYDMHGNVWEWCSDLWHDNYTDAPSNGNSWETETNDDYRVLRGGSWYYDAIDCRTALRYWYLASRRLSNFGFRVALVADESLQKLLNVSLNTSIDNISTISLVPQTKSPASPEIALKTFDFETVTVNSTGQIANQYQGQAKFFTENIGNNITIEMLAIPGGSFVMGSPNTEAKRRDNEEPQHNVTVAPFFMGKYQVTQKQWEAVMRNNPSHFKGAKRPVEQVSWYDAVEFCQKLSQKTGKSYRLPSEAEWEYACRAGTLTPFYFGKTITPDLVNYDGSYSYGAAPKGLNRKQTTDVGSFPPNAFGLYDMHGNVWEWCADPWHGNYQGAPQDGSVWDEKNNDNRYRNYDVLVNIKNDKRTRLLRGGSWLNLPVYCRSAIRNVIVAPGVRVSSFGFRVVCAIA